MGESLWFEEGWFLSQTKEKVKKVSKSNPFPFTPHRRFVLVS